jgi:ligand-binding sensor domain-containing protein
VHQGRLDVFAQRDGLSGDLTALDLFEDREGTIWVSTARGLDRFRAFTASTISAKQGLAALFVGSVLSAKDGSVWLGTPAGLYRWNNGQMTVYRRHSGLPIRSIESSVAREVFDTGMPDNVGSLFENDEGRIWVFSPSGVAYFETNRFTPVRFVPGGIVHSVAGDKAGNLWISDQDHGLYHLLGGRLVEHIPWTTLGRTDYAYALSTDPARGGVWLGFYRGGLLQRRADLRVKCRWAAHHGNTFNRDGTSAATEGGLSRVQNGRGTSAAERLTLRCRQLAIEDDWALLAVHAPRPSAD